MDFGRNNFMNNNGNLSSKFCDIFEENVPKWYLPEETTAEISLKFMPFEFPPFTTHFNLNGTNLHVTCGPIFLIIREIVKKLKAK